MNLTPDAIKKAESTFKIIYDLKEQAKDISGSASDTMKDLISELSPQGKNKKETIALKKATRVFLSKLYKEWVDDTKGESIIHEVSTTLDEMKK